MTFLGLGAPEGDKAAPKTVPVRHVLLGATGGAGIMLAVTQIISGSPKDWAGVLNHWGPWWLLSLFAVWRVTDAAESFLTRGLDLGAKAVEQIQRAADGSAAMGAALKEMADKDDRSAEETRRLAQFAAQNSEKMWTEVRKQGDTLDRIEQHLAQTKVVTQ